MTIVEWLPSRFFLPWRISCKEVVEDAALLGELIARRVSLSRLERREEAEEATGGGAGAAVGVMEGREFRPERAERPDASDRTEGLDRVDSDEARGAAVVLFDAEAEGEV